MKAAEKKIYPALFLHIQKTAGTSIVELARPHYGSSMISHGDFIGHEPKEHVNTLFVSGHFGYDYAKELMSSRYSFTFLRDPVERILSFYFFCKIQQHDQFSIYKIARSRDLLSFLEAASDDPVIKKNIWNNQVWQLSHGYFLKNKQTLLDAREVWQYSPNELLELAVSHLDNFSYVGFTETFEHDRDVIMKALGLPIPEQKVIANTTHDRPRVEDLSANVKNILDDLTMLDRQLYAIALSRRDAGL